MRKSAAWTRRQSDSRSGARASIGVEIGLQAGGAEGGFQPLGETLGGAARQRDHRLPIEGAVGLGVIGVGVVAGKAQQQGRHAEGQGDLAGGGGLGLHEIHVLRRERERLPIEAALQQQRPPGIGRALVIRLQLALEAGELRVAQRRAGGGGVDQRPGGPGGIVEEGLVPGPGGVVDVERHRRRLHRRQAVMVVGRVEQGEVEDRRHALAGLVVPQNPPADGMVVGDGPAVGAGHHPASGRDAERGVRAGCRRGSRLRDRRSPGLMEQMHQGLCNTHCVQSNSSAKVGHRRPRPLVPMTESVVRSPLPTDSDAMPDAPRSRMDALSEPRPPAYRAILLAKSGAVIGMVRLSVQDDDQALERARSMVDGHAVELWDGMRFIELFPPVD